MKVTKESSQVKALDVDEVAGERSAAIELGGEKYKLILTTKATKEIAKRYGGLESLGSKLMESKDFELALDEVVWLVTLLANQSILIHNIRNKDDKKELLQEDEVELLTTPFELAEYKNAIMVSMMKGTKRNITSEKEKNVEVG